MSMSTIIAALIAGCGAGAVTGLIGASAITFAVPILVMFAGLSAYEAIGASLLTDVVASLVAAWVYHKHGRLRIRPALIIAAAAVVGAQVGSWVSTRLPDTHLGVITAVVVLTTGLRLVLRPESLLPHESGKPRLLARLPISTHSLHLIAGLVGGLVVGLLCGVYGAGGGVSILFLLVYAMGFSPHEAIGTSVLVMAFTAASGATGHAIHGTLPWAVGILATAGGVVGALAASAIANRCNERLLARVAGVTFTVLAAVMLVSRYIL
ncbi:sulfite exporter TauE/SafE family protein [Candidatus Bipolaricaulota bacterium]